MREDIKQRRDKYKVTTPAKRLFGDKQMIVERKSGMSFAEYTYVREIQKRAIRMLHKASPNKRISALMIPQQPSVHLLTEVAKRKAVKEGYLEKIVPEGALTKNFLTNIFSILRNAFFGLKDERVPQPF
jgi:hypothetical protein